MSSFSFADFKVVDLATGKAAKQSLLVAEEVLYVFSVAQDESRSYKTYDLAQSGSTESVEQQSQALSESVIFVDEFRTPNGVVIATLHRGRATVLGSDETILTFQSIYNAPVFSVVPHFDAFRDLNADGLDDFLVPSFDGYEVAIQQPDGTFTKTTTLSAKPLMDMSYNSHPWYQAKSLFLSDMTGDDREDLVFWDESEFRVYPKLSSGLFSHEPILIPTQLQLDYDSVDGMSVQFSNQDQSNKTVTVIHSLSDYDGDGITDLMAMQVKSEGVFRKTTTFSLHAGALEKQNHLVHFSPTPSTIVQSNGIQYDMTPHDLDSDGDLDLVVSSVELGVGKIIGALLTGSIKIDLGFYLMDQGEYPAKPSTTRNITATFSLSSGEYWLPAVQLIDQNRDGRLDLWLQESEELLRIYAGDTSDKVFDSRGEPLSAPMAKDPDDIRRVDVNNDGIVDLLMQVRPPLGEDADHRAVLILSK